MNGSTTDAHADPVGWVVVPIFLGMLFYFATVLVVWPYARPLIPLWLLFLCIVLPPFFPLLLFYLLVIICVTPFPPARTAVTEVIVVEPSTRGRVRMAVPPSRSGNRV